MYIYQACRFSHVLSEKGKAGGSKDQTAAARGAGEQENNATLERKTGGGKEQKNTAERGGGKERKEARCFCAGCLRGKVHLFNSFPFSPFLGQVVLRSLCGERRASAPRLRFFFLCGMPLRQGESFFLLSCSLLFFVLVVHVW